MHYGLTGVAGGRVGLLHTYPSDMAQNFWGAIVAWTGCFVLTIAISLVHEAARREGPRGPRLLADAEAVVGGAARGTAARSCSASSCSSLSIVLNVYFW